MSYEIKYSGTPPSNQRFTLNADVSGVKLTIRYTKPGAYLVLDNNKREIPANQWMRESNAPAQIGRS